MRSLSNERGSPPPAARGVARPRALAILPSAVAALREACDLGTEDAAEIASRMAFGGRGPYIEFRDAPGAAIRAQDGLIRACRRGEAAALRARREASAALARACAEPGWEALAPLDPERPSGRPARTPALPEAARSLERAVWRAEEMHARCVCGARERSARARLLQAVSRGSKIAVGREREAALSRTP